MRTLGLDIGGANIKAAWNRDAPGSELICTSLPFVLARAPWELPGQLAYLLRKAENSSPIHRIAITMTAELCDCFTSKRQGVDAILQAAESIAGKQSIHVWSTQGNFISPLQAREQPLQVAAANWHALATHVARIYSHDRRSILIDIGSTTTDLIPLENGRIASHGFTDMTRLVSGELLYIGAAHTPIMALCNEIPWDDSTISIMAEPFATISDVYLFLEKIPENPADCDTPDAAPMTRTAAAMRLARMVGADAQMLTTRQITQLATQLAMIHQLRIREAIEKILAQHNPTRIILTGSGSWLVSNKNIFRGLQEILLADHIGRSASTAACAWALVKLQQENAS